MIIIESIKKRLATAFMFFQPSCINAEKQKAPLFLERGWGEASSKTERSMSHARSRAQRCCYCGEYAHYELNHHFPF